MNSALQKLVLYYLKEVAANEYSDDDLEYMSHNFVKQVDKLKSARKDFREEF